MYVCMCVCMYVCEYQDSVSCVSRDNWLYMFDIVTVCMYVCVCARALVRAYVFTIAACKLVCTRVYLFV